MFAETLLQVTQNANKEGEFMCFKKRHFIVLLAFFVMAIVSNACKKRRDISGNAHSDKSSFDQTPSSSSAITYEELALTEDESDVKSVATEAVNIDFKLLNPAFFMVEYDKFASSAVEPDGKLKFHSEESYALSDRCYQFVLSDKGMIYRPVGDYAFPESLIWDLKLTVITVGHFCTDKASQIKYFNNLSAMAYDDPNLVTSSFKSYLTSQVKSLNLTDLTTVVVKSSRGVDGKPVPPSLPPLAAVKATPPPVPFLPSATRKWVTGVSSADDAASTEIRKIKIGGRQNGLSKVTSDEEGAFPPPATAKTRSIPAGNQTISRTANISKVGTDMRISQVTKLSDDIKTRDLLPGERKVLADKIETSMNTQIQKLEITEPDFKTGAWNGVAGLDVFGSMMTRTATRITDGILSAGLSKTGNLLPNAKELQNTTFRNYLLLAMDLKGRGNFPAYHSIIMGLSSPNLARFDIDPEIKKIFEVEKKFSTPTGKGFFTDAVQAEMSKPTAVLSPMALKAKLFTESEKIKVMIGNKDNLDPNDIEAVKKADAAIEAATKNFEAMYQKSLDELASTKQNGQKQMSFPISKVDEDKSIAFSTAPYDDKVEETALVTKKDAYPRLN